MVIYRGDALELTRKFSDPKKKSIYIEKTLNEAAVCFGINSNALGYIVEGEGNEARLCSVFRQPSKVNAGKNGVRKNEDYMKNYFVDRYGAIKDMDFTPIFEELLSRGKEE